jgi:hypothetical protein
MASDPVVPDGMLGTSGGVSPAREGVASSSPLEPVVTGDGGAGSGGVGDSPVLQSGQTGPAGPGTAERRETPASASPKGCDTASHVGAGGRSVAEPPGEPPSSQEGPGGLARSDSPVRGTLVQRGSAVEERQAHNLEVAGAIPAPVTKTAGRSAALLQRIDDRIRRRATGIVSAALRAPEVGEAIPGRDGWTKRSIKVAADACESGKNAPVYLSMAQRIVESYKKTDAPVAPVLNAQLIQVNVTNTNVYPVRKVRDE